VPVLPVAPAVRRVGIRCSASGNGLCGELGERFGELVGPGPGALDTQPAPVLSAGQPGGDMEQPVAQRLGSAVPEMAVQEQVLGPGDQIDGEYDDGHHALLIANERLGKWSRPVFFAHPMRSSTRRVPGGGRRGEHMATTCRSPLASDLRPGPAPLMSPAEGDDRLWVARPR